MLDNFINIGGIGVKTQTDIDLYTSPLTENFTES
jgi:hypothetical protein